MSHKDGGHEVIKPSNLKGELWGGEVFVIYQNFLELLFRFASTAFLWYYGHGTKRADRHSRLFMQLVAFIMIQREEALYGIIAQYPARTLPHGGLQ